MKLVRLSEWRGVRRHKDKIRRVDGHHKGSSSNNKAMELHRRGMELQQLTVKQHPPTVHNREHMEQHQEAMEHHRHRHQQAMARHRPKHLQAMVHRRQGEHTEQLLQGVMELHHPTEDMALSHLTGLMDNNNNTRRSRTLRQQVVPQGSRRGRIRRSCACFSKRMQIVVAPLTQQS